MSLSRRRGLLLAAVWLLPALLAIGIAHWGYTRYRIPLAAPLADEARAEAFAVLRQALAGLPVRDLAHPQLQRKLSYSGPVVVTVWLDGIQQVRVIASGDTVATALGEAAQQLALAVRGTELEQPSARQRARIKLDLVLGRGELRGGLLRSLAVNAGVDGVGVRLHRPNGDLLDVVLLPDELVARKLLSTRQPVNFLAEVKLGLDLERTDQLLAVYAKLPPGAYGEARRHYYRFVVDSAVEQPESRRAEPPLVLTRGWPQGPDPTTEALQAGAIAGGHYLVGKLASNGRYVYEVDLATGSSTDPFVAGRYSLPRHAGATYFLAELYRHTEQEFLREPVQRAFGHLATLVQEGGCSGELPGGVPFACVTDRGNPTAALGSTALTVVALAEYRRATGDRRYDPLAQRLTEWLLFMQRPDGSFRHLYDIPHARPLEDPTLLYFSGEAALALARMYDLHRDSRYLDATERALDRLIGWYDFFVGGFLFGEEHWTCIAAEAAWPHLTSERYLNFCNGYAAFLRRQQPGPEDFGLQADLRGAYGFTPFWVPNNTPVGSRTEAMISTYSLGVHHGRPEAAVLRQVVNAMRYALRQQLTEQNSWAVAAQLEAIGSVSSSAIDRNVRIDYVQHVCSAMIRAAALVAEAK